MKKNVYVFVFFFACLLSNTFAQPFLVGHRSVNFRDNTRTGGFAVGGAPYWPATGSGRNIGCEVYYPATVAGDDKPFVNDSFPVVIMGHGFQMTWDSYKSFYDTLVSLGYVVILPRTEGGLLPNHGDFARDLIWITNRFLALDDSATAPYFSHLVKRTAMGGHSMGGGCTVASAGLSNPATCYFTMAAANTTSLNSTSGAKLMTKPYLDIAGSYDCIAPYATNQKVMYDSSTSPCNYLINISGASHCQFGDGNVQCNFGEGSSGCANPPTNRVTQMARVYNFLLPYLRYYLKKQCNGYTDLEAAYTAGVGLTNKFKNCTQVIPTNPSITGVLTFCAGNSTTLTANPVSFNYTWSNAATTSTISVNTAASYGLSVSNGTCITAAANVNVAQLNIPSAPTSITIPDSLCPGISGQAISISTISGATAYGWTLPATWLQTGGDTSNSILASTGAAGGMVGVSAKNSCGSSAAFTKNVVVHAPISTPTSITGSDSVCANAIGTVFSIASVTNARNYLWTLPVGWNITVGNNSNSITVTAASNSGSIAVRVVGPCDTTTTISKVVTVRTPIAAPGAISGSTSVCANDLNLSYQILPVANATGYTWSIPTGWSITNGAGSASITVSVGTSGGNISVLATGVCGNSTTASLAVNVNSAPLTPTSISSPDSICPNASGINITTPAISGATSYNWTLPSGWSQTSVGTTNAITATAASNSGSVAVSATNLCGTSNTFSKNIVTYASLVAPTTIIGSSSVCEAATNQSYSVTSIVNARGYLWSVPSGWSITAGNNTNSISVTVGTSSGNISLRVVGPCDTSATLSKTINVTNLPATPSTINGGTSVCPNTISLNYATASVAGATTYNWLVPTGWSITNGTGSTSITVNAGTIGGQISVAAANTCGTGIAATLAVNISTGTTAPTSILVADSLCPSSNTIQISTPNIGATSYNWILPNGWMQMSGGNSNSISVMYGSNGGDISVSASSSCGTSAAFLKNVFVHTPLVAPASINGSGTVCQNTTNLIYSVPAVANARGYLWSVPAGWSTVSGINTNSITVNAGTSSGQISVRVVGPCDTTAVRSKTIHILTTPANPGAISGSANVCANISSILYSVVAQDSGTSFNWILPSGWNITSGATTESIITTSGSNAGNISVTAANTCGTSNVATFAVQVTSTPATPVAINTLDSICGNTNNINVQVLSVTNATSYTWTLPNGWLQISGGTTNNLVVNASNNGGSISVTANNTCGSSAALSKTIFVQPLASLIGAITSVDSICKGDVLTLTAPVATYATTYNWTLSNGWTVLTGSTTNVIRVATTTSGNAAVVALNNCGASSPALTKSVVVVDTPIVIITQNGNTLSTTAVGTTYQWFFNNQIINGANTASIMATANGDYKVVVSGLNNCDGEGSISYIGVGIGTIVATRVLLFPNPAKQFFQIFSDEKIETIQVLNAQGQLIENNVNSISSPLISVENWSAGLYIVKLKMATGLVIKQLIKND